MKTGDLGREYQDGEIIFHQGETGNVMYIIQEGCVEVSMERTGQQIPLRLLKTGEFLGELSLFTGEVRSATARSKGVSRLLTVDKKNFKRRIQEDPSIAFHLVQMLIQRIYELSEDVAVLSRSLQDCYERSISETKQ